MANTETYICPECGSEETQKHGKGKRVCTKCGTVFDFGADEEFNY